MPKPKPIFDRTPPQHIEAERSVLGAILLNPDAIDKAIGILGEDSAPFYVEAHALAYTAVINLYRDGDPVDMVTLTHALTESGALERVGGVTYIAEFTESVPTSANVEYYAKIVREMWQRREVITVASRAAGDLYKPDSELPDVLEAIEEGVFRVATNRQRSNAAQLTELIPENRSHIQDMLDGKPLQGIRTGINSLDEALRPLCPGDYALIAARPSVGKSTFALNVAMNMAKAGTPVLFLSIEMPTQQLVKKMIGIEAGVNMRMVEKQRVLKAPTEKAINRACELLAKLPIYLDFCPGLSTLDLRSKVREAVKNHGVGVVFIDYLQIMRAPKAENRTNEVAKISQEVMQLAGEAGLPIIALSQLNREGAEQPKLTNLRDGGALEQDSGIVMFLYRESNEPRADKYSPEPVWVDIQKQRLGDTERVKLLFDKPLQRFRDLSPVREDAAPPPATPYRDDDDFDEFGRIPDNIEETYEEQEILF